MPVPYRLLVPALAALVAAPAAMSTSSPEPSPVGITASSDTAVFAGGCFWGVEAVFEHLDGVSNVVSGYAGGSSPSPSYDAVSSGTTGHAEAVRVVYDPAKISYQQLLQVFFTVAHDPTQLNRQGPDVGTQYRSAVFYRTAAQKQATERYIAKVRDAGLYRAKVVTQVAPLAAFHVAEGYHQNYLVRHPDQPYIVINDLPKLEELRKRFPALYRQRG
jgi:peptide-methionine (S)-S-oxide reductase